MGSCSTLRSARRTAPMSPPAATWAVSSVTFLISSSRWTTATRNAPGMAKSARPSIRYASLGVPDWLSVIMTADAIGGQHRGDAGPDDRGDDDAVQAPGLPQPDHQQRDQREPAHALAAVDHVVEGVGQLPVRGTARATTRSAGSRPPRRRRHFQQDAAAQHPAGQRDQEPPVRPGQRRVGVAQQRPGAEDAVDAAEDQGVRLPGPVPGVGEVQAAEDAGQEERHRGDPLPGLPAEQQGGEDESQRAGQVDPAEQRRRPPLGSLGQRAEAAGEDQDRCSRPATASADARSRAWSAGVPRASRPACRGAGSGSRGRTGIDACILLPLPRGSLPGPAVELLVRTASASEKAAVPLRKLPRAGAPRVCSSRGWGGTVWCGTAALGNHTSALKQ